MTFQGETTKIECGEVSFSNFGEKFRFCGISYQCLIFSQHRVQN